jgi:hypothetical protein
MLTLGEEEPGGSRAGFEWLVVGREFRLRGGLGEVGCAGTLGGGLRNLAGWVRRLRAETGRILTEGPAVVHAAAVVRVQRSRSGGSLVRSQGEGLKVAAAVVGGHDMLDVEQATSRRDSGW